MGQQQKQTKKHIKQLQYDKNELLNSNSEILKECTLFYQTIYSKQANCEETQNELLNKITKKVQTIQNEKLTSYINKNELKQAINQMENEKSPGIDGIPIEFYKLFRNSLKMTFYNYTITLFIEKKTTKTKQQAIIILIPKKAT